MQDNTETCPKCGGSAYYEVELDPEAGRELILKCLCGFFQAVYSEKLGIIKRPPPRTVRRLASGSQLERALTEVARTHPEPISTSSVALMMGVDPTKAASYLTILFGKGLVDKRKSRKGKAGGSTWVVSSFGRKTMGLPPQGG